MAQKLIDNWDVWKHLGRPFRSSRYLLPNWRAVIRRCPPHVHGNPLWVAFAIINMAIRDLITVLGFLMASVLLLCFAPGRSSKTGRTWP